jgi:nitroreductase
MTMDVDYLLTSTRSARKSLDLGASVDRSEIRDCLRIGLQAANGSNQQTWRWVVVSDPDLRDRIGELYREAYLSLTGGRFGTDSIPSDSPQHRLISSTEWLVQHLSEVPLLIVPCYQPYMGGVGNASFAQATLFGSIYPAVWNFQLALHSRGYGTCLTTLHLQREREVQALLGIPDTFVQACLLPVARLRPGHSFRPAERRPLEEVVAVDGWTGPPI